jgi:eukaryotic-like serine/threonine-protein kinase
MSLSAGTRLDAYEIIDVVGAGGMGEVYRARDTRLNRDVAIKVLPEHLAVDPDALARFEREAQAVAALSHPNILAIHDFGRHGDVTYAVTELLEGETLRVRLTGGALPTRRALEYAIQIVGGIAAAHERGIVHRDLKPENIFITKSGAVKILDFGLAKTAESRALASAAQMTGATLPGTVMGTVGYMSPEQVRGLAIDYRTDIFSFGVILYEMLSGRRAFAGDSQVETMNAILKDDPPDFAEINPSLPSSLDRIVRRCIEKDPADRFHSAHDLGIALEAVSGTSSRSAASIVPLPARRPRSTLLAAGIGAAALAVVAAFAMGRVSSSGPANTVPQYNRLTFRRGPIFSARLAPVGGTIVYSARWGDGPVKQLFSIAAESPDSLQLPYDWADVVAISAKNELAIVSNRREVRAYARPGTLARASLSGGASRDLLEDVQDADWLPDGSSLAVSHFVNGRYRLEFPIGKSVYETSGWISNPRVSPDGRYVAFFDHPIMGDDRGYVAVVDSAGAERRLTPDYESGTGLAWQPSGKEVWYSAAEKGSGRAVLAATLDARVRTVLSVPGTLTLADVARDGSVLLVHDDQRRGIFGVPPGATTERDLSWLDWSQPIALSDDGKMLLITEEADGGGPGYSVFLRRTDGSPAVKLGTGEALAMSADGKWVISQRLNPTPAQLVLLPTGAGSPRDLTNDALTHLTAAFVPDGRRFVFAGFEAGKRARTWIQDLSGGSPRAITPEGIVGTLVSPNGKMVMARDGNGLRKLYPLDGSGAPQSLPPFAPAEGVIGFAADGVLLIGRFPPAAGTVDVFRLDLATGTRTPVRSITPIPASLGQGGVGHLLVTPDGRSFVYGYGVTVSDLYLVKGLK